MEVVWHEGECVDRMVVLLFEVEEFFEEEFVVGGREEDGLLVDASIEDVIEAVLEGKTWTSRHYKKYVTFRLPCQYIRGPSPVGHWQALSKVVEWDEKYV